MFWEIWWIDDYPNVKIDRDVVFAIQEANVQNRHCWDDHTSSVECWSNAWARPSHSVMASLDSIWQFWVCATFLDEMVRMAMMTMASSLAGQTLTTHWQKDRTIRMDNPIQRRCNRPIADEVSWPRWLWPKFANLMVHDKKSEWWYWEVRSVSVRTDRRPWMDYRADEDDDDSILSSVISATIDPSSARSMSMGRIGGSAMSIDAHSSMSTSSAQEFGKHAASMVRTPCSPIRIAWSERSYVIACCDYLSNTSHTRPHQSNIQWQCQTILEACPTAGMMDMRILKFEAGVACPWWWWLRCWWWRWWST